MILPHGPQELISLFNKLEASMVATKLKRQLLPKVFNNGFDDTQVVQHNLAEMIHRQIMPKMLENVKNARK